LLSEANKGPREEDRKHIDANDYKTWASSSMPNDCPNLHQQNLCLHGPDLVIFNFSNSRKVSEIKFYKVKYECEYNHMFIILAPI
jgi:hypothetical protein